MSVIIYQDHIEILEEENAQLQKEVMFLRRRLDYYKTIVEVDEGEKAKFSSLYAFVLFVGTPGV